MITYLAVFALGAVLGALALLCMFVLAAPLDDNDMREIADAPAADDEIRRRYESECI